LYFWSRYTVICPVPVAGATLLGVGVVVAAGGAATTEQYRRAAHPATTRPLPEVQLRSVNGTHRRFAVGVRLASASAVFLAAYYLCFELGGVVSPADLPDAVRVWAVVLFVPVFALHVRAVWTVVHGGVGARPALTVAALALLAVVGVPLTGWSPYWQMLLHVVLATAVLLLRGRWRVAVVAVFLVALACLVGAGVFDPVNGGWLVLWRAAETFAFTWFAAVLRRLEASREELAGEVLLAERRHIDEQLERTLGAAIAAVAASAGELADRAGTGAPVTPAEVDAVVVQAQATMAEVRGVARAYRQGSLRAELATTAALLADAGIEFRVQLPDGALDGDAVGVVRRELPGVLADVLADQTVHSCTLSIVQDAAGARLAVHIERGRP
jgi:two-component system, NarL family, sensor histidine kinase DesK